MNSNFRVFWLAPVTRNILCYSLFCDQANMASRFGTFYKDEISYKQTPRKRRTLACQCSLVGRKLFSCWICNNMIARWLNIRGLHTLSLIFWQRPRISWQQCKLMFTQTFFFWFTVFVFFVYEIHGEMWMFLTEHQPEICVPWYWVLTIFTNQYNQSIIYLPT